MDNHYDVHLSSLSCVLNHEESEKSSYGVHTFYSHFTDSLLGFGTAGMDSEQMDRFCIYNMTSSFMA